MIATMKKIIFSLILLIIGIAIFNRCSNEVDLYADYKDITIVYGILDVSDDTAWVKITKAFTGPGNALTMAHNSDSSNYPYKLDVSLNGKVTVSGDKSVSPRSVMFGFMDQGVTTSFQNSPIPVASHRLRVSELS